MKYYSVKSKVFDNGEVQCGRVIAVEADAKPDSRCVERSTHDEYTDYFDNYGNAAEFAFKAKTHGILS